MDKIRQMIMIKWNQRRKISRKLDGLILPHIIKKLNDMSRKLSLDVLECLEEVAEVMAFWGGGGGSGVGSGFRFVVNFQDKTFSCSNSKSPVFLANMQYHLSHHSTMPV
jgi:hypothetical protein